MSSITLELDLNPQFDALLTDHVKFRYGTPFSVILQHFLFCI